MKQKIEYRPYQLALFEDQQEYCRTLVRFLEGTKFRLKEIATTFEESTKVIAMLGELGIFACLVDGNLSAGESDNWEGGDIVRQIKELYPEMNVVGIPLSGVVEGADLQSPKINGTLALIDVLNTLVAD